MKTLTVKQVIEALGKLSEDDQKLILRGETVFKKNVPLNEIGREVTEIDGEPVEFITLRHNEYL